MEIVEDGQFVNIYDSGYEISLEMIHFEPFVNMYIRYRNPGFVPKKGRGSKMLGSHMRIGVVEVAPLSGGSPTNTSKTL